MKEKINNILKNLNFNAKNKNILFALIGVIVLIPLTFWLLSSSENQQLSQNFENSIKENKEEQKEQGFIPPKLDSPFNTKETSKDTNNTQNKQEQSFKQEQNSKQEQKEQNLASFAKDKNEVEAEARILELSNDNLDQEEAIREIAKTQRPKDMIEFLKEKQKDIELLASKNDFKYDLKEYKVGDKFLEWFEIESINKNFIRFKDKDYAYNLRFLGD